MVFSLSVSLLNIAAAICLVLVFKVGIRGFFLATVAATGLGALWAFWELRTSLSLRRYNRRLLKEMLAFSLPLVPALLGAWAISQSSIYFLNFIRGEEEVGLFYIGNTIASMGGIFMAAFQQAWGPFAYSIEKEPNAKQFYGIAFFVYAFLGSALALLGSLFGRELLSLFTTRAYSGSSTTICFLIFSYIAAGFVTIASLGCNLSKDNRPVALGVVIGAAFSIALNLILDRSFGKDGSAAAILIAQLAYSGSVFIMAQRLMPIPYPFLAAYLVFFSFLGIGFLGSRLESIWLKLGMVAGIACLFFLFRRKIVGYVRSIDLPKARSRGVPMDGPNA
jgi:O-antigen/teichoic acid export membrane protein